MTRMIMIYADEEGFPQISQKKTRICADKEGFTQISQISRMKEKPIINRIRIISLIGWIRWKKKGPDPRA